MKNTLAAIMLALALAAAPSVSAQTEVLLLTERGGQHEPFVSAALDWLDGFGRVHDFRFTEINDTQKIDSSYLSQFNLFLQLDYPPYNWTETAQEAFEQAVFDGTIGWVGFHHATLLGEFDGFPMWDWFSDFMGGIRYRNYIEATASARVELERLEHPVMKGVSGSFVLPGDEWYTYDRNPRGRVKVLAHVDESSYEPASDVKMGDHPVVWTNERVKARNVYFQMGHDAALFGNGDFTTMFGNALLWASGPANWFPRFRVLVHYTREVEEAHRDFALDAIRFLQDMTIGDGLVVDTTSRMDDFNEEKLRSYHLVVSLNSRAHRRAARGFPLLYGGRRSVAGLPCGGLQRFRDGLAVVHGLPRRSRVPPQQLAAPAREAYGRRPLASGDQGHACCLHLSRERMVPVESQPEAA